jgi:hypothetical protein
VTTARADTAFENLRPDGNGIDALRAQVLVGFDGARASQALHAIATLAVLNLTLDAALPELNRTVTIAGHARSAAEALLEVADAIRLRVRVSRSGQLVVVPLASHAVDGAATPRDSTRAAVTLPAVHTEAASQELATFQSSTSVGAVSITGHALGAMPQFVEPDVVRAVQTLPGIAARSDYVAGFNVRGGEADQTLVELDGYPIYSPFHLGGLFSTFIDPTVGRVEMRTGGLPAQYGGRLSGVLDVRSAEPTSGGLHGTAEVSLLSSTASVGSTLGDGSWMLAGRRTYADFIVDRFKNGEFPYHFQDAQAHFDHALPGGARIGLTAYDGVDATVSDDDEFRVIWGNSVVGGTLSKTFARRPSLFGFSFGDSVTVEQHGSVSRFDAEVGVRTDDVIMGNNNVGDARVGGSVTARGTRFTHTIGYELAGQRFAYGATSTVTAAGDLFPVDSVRQRTHSTSAYADQLWRPSSKLLVDAGARVDAVGGHGLGGISPRISLKYFLKPTLALTAGTGSYRQWIHSLGREEEPVEPLQFWVGSDASTPISRARDAIVGVEQWVTPSRVVHAEGFYKRYNDLLVPNPFSDPAVHGDEFDVVDGSSYGADLLIRQLDVGGRFSGWLSYSYGVSTRFGADGAHYFPVQDRRHNLNAVGSWHVGAYTLGGRLNVSSGAPYTPVLGAFAPSRYDPVTRQWVIDDGSAHQSPIADVHNSARLPWYDRLDVSATRRMLVHGATVSPYLSVVNVFNSHNPAAYMFNFERLSPARTSFPNLPLVPTFGVTIAY